MRHLLTLFDLSTEDFFRILDRGDQHRQDRRLNPTALDGKTIALLFEKSSTRTRLSFQTAIVELGGFVTTLDMKNLQVGRGETIEDTTEVFSRYLHGVMIRANNHNDLVRMASLNRLPIINGLTDLYHPCQALADYMTIRQYGHEPSRSKLAFIGEGNNVFNSLAAAAIHTGTEIRIASPEGYEVTEEMKTSLKNKGVEVREFRDPKEAVDGAHVIYTDVWISMGQESEREKRKTAFAEYSITDDLLRYAAKDHMVLHCLPAHRGEEISGEVMDKYGPMIFDLAENRMHVQKGVLEWIFSLL